MARTKKQEPKQEVKPEKQEVVVTRAEKKDATKNLIKEVLAIKPLKHNDLLDEVAKLYSLRYGTDADNPNDVKGRVGSVLDIMKKESEVAYEGGMYALKSRLPIPAPTQTPEEAPADKPAKKTAKRTVKKAEQAEPAPEAKAEEKPAKKTVKKSVKKKETVTEKLTPPMAEEQKEKVSPLPPPPVQPIAPVVPTSPETAPEPIPERTEKPKRATRKKAEKAVEETPAEKPEKKTAKKTGKKAVKAEEKPAELPAETPTQPKTEERAEKQEEKFVEPVPAPVEEGKTEQAEAPKAEVKNPPAIKPKTELAPKAEVMDMSFLFGETKSAKSEVKSEAKPEQKAEEKTEKPQPQAEVKPAPKAEVKTEVKSEQKTEPKPTAKAEQKPAQKPQNPPRKPEAEQPQAQPKNQAKSRVLKTVKTAAQKPMTAEEKLRDNFLKKLRSLGGDYFEYYSVYLLEKYSRKNGRRLESLKISGGDRDGGIDGEIELTDRLGFRETIYIQSKNWDPDRGNERLWVVGETLLQQFIGACACKQAKEGKQHTRGIFITTSNFTPDAKRILETMSDKVVGYDGNDLFEAAKECQFGLLYENGNWKLDEKLLSGTKAFFNMI